MSAPEHDHPARDLQSQRQTVATDVAPGAVIAGARLIANGVEAFEARIATARAARHRIDVQYYIWRSDTTGRLLVGELLRAADRGVHVRVLLDDMDARSRDSELVALDRHPRIEIRLFNPFASRSGLLRTMLEVFARGSHLNRRMHNKSWIADERIAIVGGRNIGDEYFAASPELNFVDLDVLLTDGAAGQAAANFEAYWRNPASVPTATLRRVARNRYTLAELRAALTPSADDTHAAQLAYAPDSASLLQRDHYVADAAVAIVADDPGKANRGAQTLARGVLESMIDALSSARTEVLLISPYFVPGAQGTAALRDLVRRGVNVEVLTNSLAATDVAAVHSGYARYRRSLLEGGIKLYELKPALAPYAHGRRMRLGSSRASLHTKAAIIDGKRVFVGSFNLDPRSAALNCEMGAWIDSERLAAELLRSFQVATLPDNSFTVTLDEQGALRWTQREAGKRVQHARDPHASYARRAITWLLQMLPIESQL